MRVRLTWVNRNLNSSQVDVYRSATSVTNPPESDLVGIGINAEQGYYDDTTAEYGKTYYYVFKTYNSVNDPTYTLPRKVKVLVDTGPGSQELLNGDYNLGYFGKVPYTSLVTTTALADSVGLTLNSPVQPLYWDKWIRKGVVLFIPRQALGTVRGANIFYNAGIMFGTDDTGPDILTLPKVMQNKRITKNGYTYKIRLLKGIADEYDHVLPVDYVDLDTIKPYRYNSETAEINLPRFRWLATEASYMQVGDITPISFTSSNTIISTTVSNDGAHFYTAMGLLNASNAAATTSRSIISQGYMLSVTNTSLNYHWLPVLELEHQLLTIEV